MTEREEMITRLAEWQKRVKELEAEIKVLRGLTLCAPESPLMASIYSVVELLNTTLSEQIGCFDGWLNDWWLENEFGETPMVFSLPGEPLREIATIEQLADAIMESI